MTHIRGKEKRQEEERIRRSLEWLPSLPSHAPYNIANETRSSNEMWLTVSEAKRGRTVLPVEARYCAATASSLGKTQARHRRRSRDVTLWRRMSKADEGNGNGSARMRLFLTTKVVTIDNREDGRATRKAASSMVMTSTVSLVKAGNTNAETRSRVELVQGLQIIVWTIKPGRSREGGEHKLGISIGNVMHASSKGKDGVGGENDTELEREGFGEGNEPQYGRWRDCGIYQGKCPVGGNCFEKGLPRCTDGGGFAVKFGGEAIEGIMTRREADNEHWGTSDIEGKYGKVARRKERAYATNTKPNGLIEWGRT
ncbi:hypothetical protein C8R47DRAFT_1069176 [Mycena vitilis]|nr:hypothetical protein C8R47DRAFT_1069176 [Mycena vitilis]